MMMKARDHELLRFTNEVMFNVALDDLVTVTNDEGVLSVVACLDTEPLSVLLDRVAASGGYATVFSQSRLADDGSYTVRRAEFIDSRCALEQGAEQMLDEDAPNADATVGLFLDYLETQPCGVVIPARLGMRVEAATSPHAVELQPV